MSAPRGPHLPESCSRRESNPLSEITLFLDKHLRAAGAKSNLFEPGAVTLVFQHRRGIPRLAQNLALGPLLAAATANKKLVDADSVQQALLDKEAS